LFANSYGPVLLYLSFPLVLLQVSLTQARIDMSELDEDSDGFLQPHVWTPQHMLMRVYTLEVFFHALIIFYRKWKHAYEDLLIYFHRKWRHI
jgi:hypothetical protein